MSNLISALNEMTIEVINEALFEFGNIVMISVLGIKAIMISYKLIAGKHISEAEIKQTISGAVVYMGYLALPGIFSAIRLMIGL